jgi:hypothetical protein
MNVQPEFMPPVVPVVQSVGMPVHEPSYVTIRSCEATKLEPVIVTEDPTAPNEGLREMNGEGLALAT